METVAFARPAKPAIAALPLLLVLLWSSGYVASKAALGYAGPLTLILVQFAAAAAILLLAAAVSRAPWPTRPMQWAHLAIVGVLIQGLQYIGLYSALDQGLSTGVAALMIGLTPIFTGLGSAFLGERVSAKQWWSLWAGLLGVALVIAATVHAGSGTWVGYQAIAFAVIGITAGALYQKRFCAEMDARSDGFIQMATATVIVLPLAYAYEGLQINLTSGLVLSSAWLSLISAAAPLTLLHVLTRQSEANKTAGLFYLIPVIAAMIGFLALAETLSMVAIIGFGVTVAAIYPGTRR